MATCSWLEKAKGDVQEEGAWAGSLAPRGLEWHVGGRGLLLALILGGPLLKALPGRGCLRWGLASHRLRLQAMAEMVECSRRD